MRNSLETGGGKVGAHSRAAGSRSDRHRKRINFESAAWLFKHPKKYVLGYDGLLVDELSKLKKSGGTTFRAIRGKLKGFTWRVGMTGTPTSEDLLGLFGQVLIIDAGERLGTNFTKFKEKYFYPTDFRGYKWEIRGEDCEWALMSAINDLVHVIPDYTDELPAREFKRVDFVYTELAKTGVIEDAVTADNAAVLSGKLLQVASGFFYDSEGEARELDRQRCELCEDIVSECEGGVMIAYWFNQDLDKLRESFPNAGVIGSGMSKGYVRETIAAWNAGELKVLLLHPRSAGHGLQLEQGGHNLIFYGPIWSRDLFTQTVARLWRKGQKKPVTVYTLCARNSVDGLVIDRSNDKKQYYKTFLSHIDALN